VTIRVSGKLFEGHLPYLEQLVQSAADCRLWPVLSLANLEDLDSAALVFLSTGEDRTFAIASCPAFVRNGMRGDQRRAAA